MIPTLKTINEFTGEKVNGFCFHRDKPWILAGDVSGVVKIWDHNTGNLIRQVQAHEEASVQSVHWHVSSPYSVSGGSDGNIVAWDYEDSSGSETSLFILEGHEAIVNSVQFHNTLPWIVSASNDRTVRIWNWLSRACIATLTHHSRSVTTASFHPKEDLILSASIDGEVCVWDASDITDSSASTDSIQKSAKKNSIFARFMKWKNGARLKGVISAGTADGPAAALVHAIFHPTLPFIFSTSDDYKVYIWDIRDSDCYVGYRVLHSETRGVSCLAYSEKLNAIMTTPDGQNITLFDASSGEKGFVGTLYQERSNLSNISPHPTKNLVAIGHADGFTVCRIPRQPPAFDTNEECLYYVKDNFLRFYDYKMKNLQVPVKIPIEDPNLISFRPTVTSLSCSPQGNYILLCLDNGRKDRIYKLLHLSNENGYSAAKTVREVPQGGYGRSAIFVAPDRFVVVIDDSKTLWVKNLENEVISEIVLPFYATQLFSACNGQLLFNPDGKVLTFDIHQREFVAKLRLGFLEHASWAGDFKNVALLAGSDLFVADKKFEHHYIVEETEYIESGAWDNEHHVFIYKTGDHIKYCLADGKTGSLMPYGSPLYITRVLSGTLYCLDDDGEFSEFTVDATEYIHKSSVLRKDYMTQCSSLCKGS